MTQSNAETLLAVQLEQAGIPFEREYHFVDKEWTKAHGFVTPTGRGKDWRADFVLKGFGRLILVEVEGGSYTGGHRRGRAYEEDCDKHNAAMSLGWTVYRFTPAHVNDERALNLIRAALGLEKVA